MVNALGKVEGREYTEAVRLLICAYVSPILRCNDKLHPQLT